MENITHYHYGLNEDTDNFFTTMLPQLALQHESLLNAVVGFAAYQKTIKNPQGKIEHFLGYYNRSVSLLLGCLKSGKRHNHGTLVTILQLATIEVGHRGARYLIVHDHQADTISAGVPR